jgi:ParB family chromosome partitioning protein
MYQTIDLDQIHESASNPRQHFDEKGMAELTDSIRTKGVVAPLLLRPMNGFYELVDGARRYRAALAAGLKSVPAITRHLSDDDALEIQVISNLQRQDVHPLDEAEGYKRLLDTTRYDVPALAAKVGKSAAYVYKRLALNDLITEAKKGFLEDKLTLGHAVLLARIPAADQRKLFRSMFAYQDEPWSVGQLKEAIEDEVLCVLDAVGFDKKDPLLVTKAGACTVCPKRSGFNKELFNDITTKDRCMDPGCFHSKVESHLNRIEAQAKRDGKKLVKISTSHYSHQKGVVDKAIYEGDNGWRAAKKGCPKPETGVIVDGDGVGRVVQICQDKGCKVCNSRGAGLSGGSASSSHGITPAARYKRRVEIWNEKVEQLARANAVTRILPFIDSDMDRVQMVMMIREISRDLDAAAAAVGLKIKFDRYRAHHQADYVRLLEKATKQQLAQILWHLVMQQELIVDVSMKHDQPEAIEYLAAYFTHGDVNMTELRKTATVELDKAKPKPPKKDKPAEKKAKREARSHD